MYITENRMSIVFWIIPCNSEIIHVFWSYLCISYLWGNLYISGFGSCILGTIHVFMDLSI